MRVVGGLPGLPGIVRDVTEDDVIVMDEKPAAGLGTAADMALDAALELSAVPLSFLDGPDSRGVPGIAGVPGVTCSRRVHVMLQLQLPPPGAW